jgi:cell division protein FtsQ
MVIDDRIAARRADVRDESRRRRLKRTIATIMLLVVVVALVLVERSALVGLEEVTVTGTDRLDPDEVREAAGLDLGTSTLRLDLDGASGRVERLPLVRTATARRLDPLTVEIAVVEREPLLRVRGGGEERLVDRDGVVILEGADDPVELLVVTLPDTPPPLAASVSADATLANAHAVWIGLSGPLRSATGELRAEGPDELSLLLERGIEVRIGRAERLDEKVRALGAILEDIGDSDEVAIIDVRAPTAPVVRGR